MLTKEKLLVQVPLPEFLLRLDRQSVELYSSMKYPDLVPSGRLN
jgi:hypothetical protein